LTLSPVPVPVPIPAPTGSSATDVDTIIPSNLLAYLTNSTKTSLLSASNIGKSTTSEIENALEVIDVLTNLTTYQVDAAPLDSLANSATSTSFAVSNIGSSRFARLVILLGEFQPNLNGKVSISDGTTAYELTLANTLSEKRLEFNELSDSFVSSFTVTNSTGVTFPSYGNSIVVVPL